MRYRPDIDGLRAVAVVPVVLFHAGFRFFPGGFVGVDVFFVISGYLITALIAPEIEAGRFTYAAFYKRRVLRLFPALFVMFLAVSVLAYVYMLPSELEDYAGSLVAAALSVSNLLFAHQAGYFDAPALTKPLLHTWSLGVEEQFYLVFPVFLALANRFFRGHLKAALAAAAALSFVAGTLVALRHPAAAFYGSPFRFWELALGGLGALGALPLPRPPWLRDLAGATGLVAIAAAVFAFSPATPWAAATLVPVLGALLVILAGDGGSHRIGRLLSLPPVVFVGLVSYSLYLWHWPIIVFQNSNAMIFHNSASYATKLGLVALSFAAAILSWRFVERPFRRGFAARRPRRILAAAAASVAAVGLAAGGAFASGGAAYRYPPDAVAVGGFLAYDPSRVYRQDRCFVSRFEDYDRAGCLRRADDRPNDLLLGDSHGAHLWWGLATVFRSVNVMQATASGCKPVVSAGGPFDAAGCSALMRFVFDDYLAHERVDRVILAAQWKAADIPKIAATLEWLRARHIPAVLVGPIVQYDYALPRLLADSLRDRDAGGPGAHRTAGLPALDADLRSLAVRDGAAYVSLLDLLCPGGACQTYAGAVPLQFDYGHLTAEGSVLVAQRWQAEGPTLAAATPEERGG